MSTIAALPITALKVSELPVAGAASGSHIVPAVLAGVTEQVTVDQIKAYILSLLPALAISSVTVVASQVAQLALSAQEGDVAVRTDLNKSYIRNAGVSGTMADWQELLTPTDSVLSINGKTGAAVLTAADIAEPVNTLTISAGAITIDCSLGNYFKVTLTANITAITITNWPAAGFAKGLMIEVKQDATGGRTMTGWPAAVKVVGGAYVPTAAANAIDELSITSYDQGAGARLKYTKGYA